MKIFCQLIIHLLCTIIKLLQPGGVKCVLAENMVIKQQLLVLNRKNTRCPKLTISDRIIFGFLASIINHSRLSKLAVILKPKTLLLFHKALVSRKYRKLFSAITHRNTGPKGPSQELIRLIVEMKKRNPRFGSRRIAMQINNSFGTDINKDTVLRVLAKYYKPPLGGNGPSWLSFIGNIKDNLWSVDLFRVESMCLKSHWIMVVMDQFTRRIIGFSVHKGAVDGVAACCMFNRIISNKKLPKYLSSDNDPLFKFHRWKANLRVLDFKEIKSIPQPPRSHPFVERLIKSCRN